MPLGKGTAPAARLASGRRGGHDLVVRARMLRPSAEVRTWHANLGKVTGPGTSRRRPSSSACREVLERERSVLGLPVHTPA
jgi:hypothetical protein